ncbi:MAG TPA: MBL fold metallo-hydrolase [Thermoleophilaceae bacterium]
MPLEIEWLGHASVLIELDGVRVITDPLLRRRTGPLVRVVPPVRPDAARDVDAVLLSHLHADHADPASLRRITAPVVAPRGAAGWLRRHRVRDARELSAGEALPLGALEVLGVRARHEDHRYPLGPTAEPLGFVVRGSKSVYFAGDTDLFDEMAELRGVDVALLPVWGWGTKLGPGHLDPARAAQAAAIISPRVAIPIHWGTLAMPRPVGPGRASETPPQRFAELAAREAPQVEVRVLRPGERTTV